MSKFLGELGWIDNNAFNQFVSLVKPGSLGGHIGAQKVISDFDNVATPPTKTTPPFRSSKKDSKTDFYPNSRISPGAHTFFLS